MCMHMGCVCVGNSILEERDRKASSGNRCSLELLESALWVSEGPEVGLRGHLGQIMKDIA